MNPPECETVHAPPRAFVEVSVMVNRPGRLIDIPPPQNTARTRGNLLHRDRVRSDSGAEGSFSSRDPRETIASTKPRD